MSLTFLENTLIKNQEAGQKVSAITLYYLLFYPRIHENSTFVYCFKCKVSGMLLNV